MPESKVSQFFDGYAHDFDAIYGNKNGWFDSIIKKMGMQVLREGRPIIFYVHPREIDPSHPRLPMKPVDRFKSYVNLGTTRSKMELILDDFTFTTFGEMIALGKTHGEN